MIVLFSSSQRLSYAAPTLLYDDFQDGNSEGWTETNPWGSWTTQDGDYIGKAKLFSSPASPSYSFAGDESWQNYEFETILKSNSGIDKQVLFRVNSLQHRSYILNVRSSYFNGGNDVILAKRSPLGSEKAELLAIVPYINFASQLYKINIKVVNEENNARITVYIDNQLILDYVDSINPILYGAVGFEVVPGGYQPNPIGLVTETGYQYALVKSIDPSLPVPDIKQYALPWRNVEYDHAHTWSPNNDTIERWGCALTSASMVLGYNGLQVTPDTLNQYLQLNNGYARNGAIIWGKVSRYTKEHESASSQVLEYVRSPFSLTLAEEELNANRPPIIQLLDSDTQATHFVVLKGKKESDFIMNDPATSEDTLSYYSSDQYSRIDTFIPSHTDLSYIELLIDEPFKLTVFDPEEVQMTTGFGKEFPIHDDLPGNPHLATTLSSFLLAKPKDGTYRVEITGNSNYRLDSYLFDKEGKSEDKTITGNLNGKLKEILFVTVGEHSTIQKLTFDTIISDIDKARNDHAITKYAIYVTLRASIRNAKRHSNLGHRKISISFLNAALQEIEIFKARGIRAESAAYLAKQITFLKDSL